MDPKWSLGTPWGPPGLPKPHNKSVDHRANIFRSSHYRGEVYLSLPLLLDPSLSGSTKLQSTTQQKHGNVLYGAGAQVDGNSQ